ncbi:RNA directed DNA polymerase (reverse transcriptase) [Echinococcus multilocularis]|uniref:RNA directed DNA polymerase (Reverse transcriptase) n=1 Tax=Echinococcus multilocularis TaxID=6211 RepID=A0A0S4MMM9_ECHMU|nr:RNA directed DNA polymerase (reverse transcriptase) [Echinococcus multilocularis]
MVPTPVKCPIKRCHLVSSCNLCNTHIPDQASGKCQGISRFEKSLFAPHVTLGSYFYIRKLTLSENNLLVHKNIHIFVSNERGKDSTVYTISERQAKCQSGQWQRRRGCLMRDIRKEAGILIESVNAGITHDTDIDQCCDELAQLVIDLEERSLVRHFFVCFQKADEDDKEYAKNLQLPAGRGFIGCLSNKVSNWVTVQFRHGVGPPALVGKLCDAKTNSLGQLVKLTTLGGPNLPEASKRCCIAPFFPPKLYI